MSRRGRIFTPQEMERLWSTGATHDEVVWISKTKIAFNAKLTEVTLPTQPGKRHPGVLA